MIDPKQQLKIYDERIQFLFSWNPGSKEFQDRIPGAIYRLGQKIANLEKQING